jgi:hypothetical protein
MFTVRKFSFRRDAAKVCIGSYVPLRSLAFTVVPVSQYIEGSKEKKLYQETNPATCQANVTPLSLV